MTIINKEKKYRALKESIRMMNGQRSDVEKTNLIEENKKMGINEVINNSLKQQIHTYKMKSYYLKCRKDAESVNPKLSVTNNGKTVILSKCGVFGNRKSRFIKNQEAKGLLSKLDLKTPLSKVPILGDILF